MDSLLCNAISAKGIPMDDLNTMAYGIPLTAFGVDLEDPECYAANNDLLPILALFGIEIPDDDTYRIEVAEAVYAAGRAIAASLQAEEDVSLQQGGYLGGSSVALAIH